jgi:hypothetical protein
MRLQFGITAFDRERGNLPELPVLNMFAEAAPTEESGIALQSRPGLMDRSDSMGTGPVQALYKQNGVLSGGLYGVSGGTFYNRVTAVGSIAGTNPVSMAGFEDLLFITAGTTLYQYDGATLSTVAMPGSASAKKIVVGGSRLVVIAEDTETYYWSDVLSATIGALSFTSAESKPDQLRDMLFIDDTLILFGANTIEFHANTTDANLPFQPLEGRVFERGTRGTVGVTAVGSSFAWVTDINQICLGDPETVISAPWLNALIEASDNIYLWAFVLDGQEFLALRLDDRTFVYGMASAKWSEFSSYGETNWIPSCYADGVFGSSLDGKTLAWASNHLDMDGVLERRFRAGQQLDGGAVTIRNLSLRTNAGETPYLTGDYTNPTVEVRFSRDGGRTFGEWRQTTLGEQGRYNHRVQWPACGTFGRPGILAEFRVTDPVPFRVSAVLVNEALTGL